MNFDYIILRVYVINIKNLEYVDMQWTTKHDDFNKRYSVFFFFFEKGDTQVNIKKQKRKRERLLIENGYFLWRRRWRFFNFYDGIDKANSFCMELELFRGAKATNFKMVFVGFIYF